MDTEKALKSYTKLFGKTLARSQVADAAKITRAFKTRLANMYASEDFRRHSAYPSIDTAKVYAVIALGLELREHGYSDREIIDLVNCALSTSSASFTLSRRLSTFSPVVMESFASGTYTTTLRVLPTAASITISSRRTRSA